MLKQLRERLRATRNWAQASLSGSVPATAQVLQNNRELLDPLELCYQSLHECGMGVIADGPLLDCLRRAVTFGLFLVRLDVRQDSSRHTAAMTEITDYLGLGRYGDWSEKERIDFLMRELGSRRPLLPGYFKPSADTAEVLATCREIAAAPAASLGSMSFPWPARLPMCSPCNCCSRKPACCGRCVWCRCSKPWPTWTTPAR